MSEQSGKGRFAALLTGDHLRLGDLYRQQGKKKEAIRAYAKGGDWKQAGLLAIEIGDLPQAVDLFLRGAFGKAADEYGGANAAQAGEILASSGHLEEALILLEIGGALRAAASAALKLKQPAKAATLFERAKDYDMAANCYEQVGRTVDALRVLEAEAARLGQAGKGGGKGAASDDARRAIDMRRATLLSRLGRGVEAQNLLRAWGASTRSARLLESSGSYREAAEAYLEAGEAREALRLVGKATGLAPRKVAEIYLQTGHGDQAARILAGQGAHREAAAAYEGAAQWEAAAREWQAAREHRRAGEAYLKARRRQEAARCFEQAGDLHQAADAFAQAGEAEAAANAYLSAGEPLAASTHFLSTGNRSAAAQALQKVPPGGPDFEQATLLLVPLLMEDGLLDAALHRLRMLPAAGPGASTSALDRLYFEGRVLEELGRGEEALHCYQKLVALRREHRDAAARLKALAARLDPTRRDRPAVPAGPARPPAAVAPRAMVVGDLLAGRYEIQAELGRGGMGQVFKAHDRELGEAVAIKTLLRRPGETSGDEERLLREVQICRKITHPNVVRVFDLGRVEGGIFVTMELVEGTRLDQLIGHNKQLSLPRVRSILTEIAEGLKEAHALGVVHRDLKPGNVMVTPTRLKILDFGIARMAGPDEERLTRTGVSVGSPLYMSPEQIHGHDLDGRSDLYSLGVLAFTLIAGREPFLGATTTAIILAHLQTPPPDLRRLRPDAPVPWCDFVSRLLAKLPDERYASAQEVLGALAALPG